MNTKSVKEVNNNHTIAEWPQDELEFINECPLCRAKERAILYTMLTDRVFFCAPGKWTLYRCKACQCGYLDPRPTPNSIGLAYKKYFTHGKASAGKIIPRIKFGQLRLSLRNGYLNTHYGYKLKPALKVGYFLALLFPLQRSREHRGFDHLNKPFGEARLLDVGCGNGFFLLRMKAAGWIVEGLEPDAAAVKAANLAGLEVRQGLLTDLSVPDNYYDAVTLNHVIEHLHDPLKSLQVCYRILKPGGLLFIATPNLNSPGHKWFERNWLALDPPRHLILFTSDSLKTVVEDAGLEILSQKLSSTPSMGILQQSLAIAKGLDPNDKLENLNWKLKIQSALASFRGLYQPEYREELVLLARKPELK